MLTVHHEAVKVIRTTWRSRDDSAARSCEHRRRNRGLVLGGIPVFLFIYGIAEKPV